MIYFSIGRRELGKTTLAYHMARRIPRRTILDPRGMIPLGPASEPVTKAIDLRAAHASLFVPDLGVHEVVYHPHEDDLRDSFVAWTAAVKATIIHHPNTPIAIVVDEASFFNLEHPIFQWLAKCTYRDQVHIIITAHRPADIPTSIRSIGDHWLMFRTTQEHDLEVIERRTTLAAANAVARLRGREYVHWDDARGTMNIVKDSTKWYVKLRASSVDAMPALESVPEREFELDD